jgi:hypothetical protein
MDINSPVYREKYLKYKNKYLELKSLEENQSAGYFSGLKKGLSSASASLHRATGTDQQSIYNASVMALFKVQVADVYKVGTDIVAGLPSAQQTQVTKTVYDMLAHSITGYGPAAKAISAIVGTHDSKGAIAGVVVPSAEDKLKEVLQDQLKTSDVMSYAKPLLLEGLATLHSDITSKVNTVEVKTANSTVNATSIKNLNDQIIVETLCKNMGLNIDACDKKKIDAAKRAFKELETINKTKIASTKSAIIFDTTRDNAQKAMDNFATSLSKNMNLSGPGSGVSMSGLDDLILTNELESIDTLRKQLKLSGTKGDALTKEILIKEFANPDYHVPTDYGVPPTPPASPKAAVEVPDVNKQ